MSTKVAAVIVGWFGALATFGLVSHEVAHAAAGGTGGVACVKLFRLS
jgi:hypothetical protein